MIRLAHPLWLMLGALFLLPYFYLMLQIDNRYRQAPALNKPVSSKRWPFPAAVMLLLPLMIALGMQWLVSGLS